MNPSVEDRLNSVLRALETVVLPALPEHASLAQEQVMLAIGHIQIIQAQRDAAPAFEQGELADISAMAEAILDLPDCPPACEPARENLREAVAGEKGYPRERAETVRRAIDELLVSARQSGSDAYRRKMAAIILPLGRERARKDREWFAAMGFDIELSG